MLVPAMLVLTKLALTMLALSAIAAVLLASFITGALMTRRATTAPDFLVASRRILPGWNAAAIAGEYISAASALGLAGLLFKNGIGAMWYAVGFTAGYVLIASLTAGPMRRSGAYTVADFAEYRFGSVLLRRMCGLVGAVILLLYLVPQLKAAGVVLQAVSGLPYSVGVIAAGVVITVAITAGGIRSATYVQAFHYIVKLIFLAGPALYLIFVYRGETWSYIDYVSRGDNSWATPLIFIDGHGPSTIATLSILVATTVGAVGLPHVIMRFHASPGARSARRVAVGVIVLLGIFYLFPVLYGTIARGTGVESSNTDLVSIALPAVLGHPVLLALVAAGAFAAFLSTSSGLLIALASSLTHDLHYSTLNRLRVGVAFSCLLAVALALPTAHIDINILVGWAFTVAASTFAPMLILGIWSTRVNLRGVLWGMSFALVVNTGAAIITVASDNPPLLAAYPALWAVPLSFGCMLIGSRYQGSKSQPPESSGVRNLVHSLHTPQGPQ